MTPCRVAGTFEGTGEVFKSYRQASPPLPLSLVGTRRAGLWGGVPQPLLGPRDRDSTLSGGSEEQHQ